MIAPGTILQNRYLVEEQIGQGGMGAVFVATDQRFGSRVALKETFFTDPNLRKAFEREARLLNRLRHHALPRVSDHFTEEEGQFLVMEYIPGDDLYDMLKKRGEAFPLSDVLAWADQLLDALDYLHTQETPVIHRDIKPQNLKLTARNQIVLLDFGLAKGTPLQTRVTATGSVLGYSLNYAPLEQMQGAGTDPRSDLYSLGATLRHLSTGETPPDALTRATAVLNGDEDPLRPANEIHAQVPPAVAAVLTRAMSQSAARRFASAAEMRDALREAARDLPAEPNVTAAHAANAPTLISEQETRLMNEAGTAHAPARGNGAKETNVNGRPDAPTLTEAARTAPAAQAAPHAQTKAPDADSVSTSVRDKGSVSTDVRDADSVVTRVGAGRAAAPPGGGRSRRTIGVVAGGVVAVALVAAVYAFTRRAERPANVEQPAAQTATPAVNTQPAPTVETQPQTAEAPSPTPAPAQQPATRRAGGAATTREASRANANRAGGGVHVVVAPEPPEVPEFNEEEMRRLREAQALSNRNAGLTPEQIRAVMQRAAEARRRAIEQRRTERERRRRAAPVPPPQP